MKAQNLKAGQKVQMLDARKGTIIGVIKENDPKSEFLSLYLLIPVKWIVNEWEEGDELSCRKEFLSSIKLLEVSKKKEKILFPIDSWGKDHWSLLAYCECRAVDHGGNLDLVHMRINSKKRKFSNGAHSGNTWNPEWATRFKNGKKPDPTHDDVDILDDLQREGFLTYKVTCEWVVSLTDKGTETSAQMRHHKSSGGVFNTFELTKQLA